MAIQSDNIVRDNSHLPKIFTNVAQKMGIKIGLSNFRSGKD